MVARPLRLILTLQTVLVALLPFVVAAGLGALWLPPQVRSEVEARQGQLAGAVASQVETYLTASLASVQDLAAIISFEGRQGGHLQQILDSQVRQDGTVRAIYVTGPEGRVRAVALGGQAQAQQKDLLGMDMSRNSLFRQIRDQGGPVWSDTFLSVVGGGLSVALAVPSGPDTVIGELRLDNLSRHLQHLATEPRQLMLVLDRRGQVIADQEGRHTAQQLNVSDIPLVRQGLAGGGPAVGGLDFDGVAMIGSLVKTPTLDWYVLVALPAKEAYQPLLAILGIFATALALTLLAGLAAAVWLSH
ncbi:MAG: cache domain-containing protein, partial [Desulfarculus sp.]|nr:cache domain-containing protein [Desulfarculus sp.]